MASSLEPQTERELLLQLNSDVKVMKEGFTESIDRLGEIIDEFGKSLKSLEEQKLVAIQKEVDELKSWRQEIKGGWKLAMIFGTVISFLLGLFANKLFK